MHNFFHFFQLQGGDSGVFLVAVSDHVNSGDSEEVARAVLQEKYQVCSYHLLQTIHSSFLCVIQKKNCYASA